MGKRNRRRKGEDALKKEIEGKLRLIEAGVRKETKIRKSSG